MAKKSKKQQHEELKEKFNAEQAAKAGADSAPPENPDIEDENAVLAAVAPAGPEEPPFYATEWIFAGEAGNRRVVYTPVGAPQPPTPAKCVRLLDKPVKFPFPTAEARDKAVRGG